MGVMNGLAVTGAQRGLRAGFNGRERRALTAGESFITALCGVVGIGLFLFIIPRPWSDTARPAHVRWNSYTFHQTGGRWARRYWEPASP